MKQFGRNLRYPAVVAAACVVTACVTTDHRSGQSLAPGEDEFLSTVKPLLESRCVWCHSNREASGGLNFQDRSATLDPQLAFVVPGDPDKSRLYRAVTHEAAHPRVMPGDGWGITGGQEAAIKDWIVAGAPWPVDRSGRIKRKPYRVDHDDYR